MTATEFVEVTREGIFVLLLVGAPAMLVALGIGLIVSLFQALTQIQEATLTFVPKIVAVMLTLIITLPFMLAQLNDYTVRLMERIVNIE